MHRFVFAICLAWLLLTSAAWADYRTSVLCAQLPALTGAVTTTAGSCVTSGAGIAPTQQRFTSGTAATYTTPANATELHILACAGGGGGGGSGGTTGPNGTVGNTTTFNSVNAAGGGLGDGVTSTTAGASGAGGTGGSGTATWRVAGQAGLTGIGAQIAIGPAGGASYGTPLGNGGQGASSLSTSRATGGAGGGGECFFLAITSPAGTYTYTVGASAAGGVGTGTGAASGAAGAAGFIIVDEFYAPVSGIGNYTTTTGITATGTTLAGCTVLTTNVNIVSTVTATNYGVCLPVASIGYPAYVSNQGQFALTVWPSNSSTQINVLGNGVGIKIIPGATGQFQAVTTTQWYTQP